MLTTIKNKDLVPGVNHRTYIDPEELDKTRQGIIAAGGILQPILVRPLSDGRHEIIAGYCRWMLTTELYGDGFDMPALVKVATDAEAAAFSIIENDKRNNPSIPDLAQGARNLLHINGGDKALTASQLGWKADMLDRRLLLLQCDPAVLQAATKKQILLGHAELLAGLTVERQLKVLPMLIDRKVTVEKLKEQLGQFAKRLSDAVFDTAQCLGCPHNSAQQAAMFDESLGEGYCQHPTHYDELTVEAVRAKAEPLREQYQVVKIVLPTDGFKPLPVKPLGELGVGEQQYSDCKACASFGCSVSALPGSYGQVEGSLCFDDKCHADKVAARRREDREAAAAEVATEEPAAAGDTQTQSPPKQGSAAQKAEPKRPSNHTPARVAEHRVDCWRTWVAKRLMLDPGRCHRVLAALAASDHASDIAADKYLEAARKVAKTDKLSGNGFKAALEQIDAVDAVKLPTLVQAIAASAAFGVDQGNLEALLNYLEVDETQHFKLSSEYLELLTMSELESLAEELKLKKAMGEGFNKARGGKKPDFIAALLNVKGMEYQGLVPRAMRYPRRKYRFTNAAGEPGNSEQRDAAAAPDPTTPADAPA